MVTFISGSTIAIPQIQKKYAVIPQHSANFSEHLYHLGNVCLWRVLKANLQALVIVTVWQI